MQKEIRVSKKRINKLFQPKISILTKLAGYQWYLAGIYTQNILLKQRLGLSYIDNVLLNNVILTHGYWTFSILLLIRNTMYGSARPVLRQFFESLIIAKGSQYDDSITLKWSTRKEGKDKLNQISIERDIFQVVERRNKPIGELRATWADLNDMTHPTRWSQQTPRIGTDMQEIAKEHDGTSFIPNVHFTLDLLFMNLCMYNHLLFSHYGRKAYRWYMGYPKDPLGVHKKEDRAKKKINEMIDNYYKTNNPAINSWIKERIAEYRRDWKA